MQNFSIDGFLKELEEIVNIDSGSSTAGGVAKVADKMEEKYKGLGLNVIRHDFSSKAGPCLEVRTYPGEDIDVLLVGHMDTVFPEGTVEDRPFSIKGDSAYGPGVMDMKSGLLSIFYVVKDLLSKNSKLKICVAMNNDEEIHSLSSKDWLMELAKISKYAFVMEPGRKGGELVNSRKGVASYIVKIKGRAAHAGVAPQDGINAVHEISLWISELMKLNNYEIGTSLSVGVVKGGTATNVVPDYAECHIDTRFIHMSENKKIEDTLEKLKNSPFLEGAQAEILYDGKRPPMALDEKAEKLMKVVEKAGEETGFQVNWVSTGGGSDANFISYMGCPVLDGMGPTGDRAHSSDEVMVISSVEPKINLSIRTLELIEEMLY